MEKTYYIRKVGGGGVRQGSEKKKSECWSLFHVPPPPWLEPASRHEGKKVWVLRKSPVLQIKRCKYVIFAICTNHTIDSGDTEGHHTDFPSAERWISKCKPHFINHECPGSFWIGYPGDEAWEQIHSYLEAQPMHLRTSSLMIAVSPLYTHNLVTNYFHHRKRDGDERTSLKAATAL